MDELSNDRENEEIEENNEKSVNESDMGQEGTDNENVEKSDEVKIEEFSEEFQVKKNNKVGKIIFGVIGGAVLIAAIVFAFITITSPKFTYFRLVGNGFNSVTNMAGDLGKSVFGQIMNVDTSKKMSVNTEVSTNIETQDEALLEWLGGLKTVKLTAVENTDLKNSYFDSNINIGVNDEAVILVDLLRNSNVFSAKADNITDGYISVDNNNLSTFWEKIGYKGPDKFTSQVEVIEKFKLSNSEQRILKSAFGKIGTAFTTAFDNQDFSKGNGTVTYGDKTIKAGYIDFKMNSAEMNNGIIACLEQLLKEDGAIDVLLKLSNAYDEMYAQIGYQVKPMTRDEFVGMLTNFLEQVKQLSFSSEEGMIIRLYSKGSKIIKVEIFNMNYSNSMLRFVMIDEGKDKYYEYSNDVQSYTDNVTMADKGIWTHEININFINSETGEFLEGYGDKIIVTADNSSKKYSKIIASSESGAEDYTLIGRISDNEKSINLNILASNDSTTNELDIKCNIKENSDFEEKLLNADEAFDTTKATDEEINTKKGQIINNWNTFANSNATRIKQLYTAISIYLGNIVPQNTYSSGNDWESLVTE